MNIVLTNPDQQHTDPAFTDGRYRATVFLELTTMRGEIHREAREVWLTVPNDRQSLPEKPTILDLVQLVFKRLHPKIEYIAEQNGVKVHVHQHALPRRRLGIEYGADGMACRLYVHS